MDAHPDTADLVVLISETGCRLGEALAAEWGDIDFVNRRWSIRGELSLRRREIPLTVRVVEMLQTRAGRWCSDGSRRILTASRHRLARDLRRAGTTARDLRHRFAVGLMLLGGRAG